jgi:hypothetical protein
MEIVLVNFCDVRVTKLVFRAMVIKEDMRYPVFTPVNSPILNVSKQDTTIEIPIKKY